MIVASQGRKSLTAWLAAAVIGAGALTLAAPAEARFGGFGGFHGGMGGFGGGFGGFHRPFMMHPGFAGHGFVGRGFAGRPFFGRGFVGRPFFGRRFVGRPFFFRRHNGFGNAFAVGLVSGAALGAFGYPYYSYPYYPYYSSAYDEDCYVVRRRIVTRWGGIVVRRALVCS
jgi:hypothetical protein